MRTYNIAENQLKNVNALQTTVISLTWEISRLLCESSHYRAGAAVTRWALVTERALQWTAVLWLKEVYIRTL